MGKRAMAGRGVPGRSWCQPVAQGQALRLMEASLGVCQWSSPKLRLTGLSGQGKHCRQTPYVSFILPPCSEWSLTKSMHFLVSIQAFLSSHKCSQEHLICNRLLQHGGSCLRQTRPPHKPQLCTPASRSLSFPLELFIFNILTTAIFPTSLHL